MIVHYEYKRFYNIEYKTRGLDLFVSDEEKTL